MAMDWTMRTWEPTEIEVGPCAWRVGVLAEAPEHVRERPSLVVVLPEDEEATLERAAEHVGDWPVLLHMAEPSFARRFPEQVERRMKALGVDRVAVLSLAVDEPADLKTGGMLQAMFRLREEGRAEELGVGHPDARVVEWMAMNTAVRVLGAGYGLGDQSAEYRALARAGEYGMAMWSLAPAGEGEALRFALGRRERVLPVADRPWPAEVEPMSEVELMEAWRGYDAAHGEPAALERSTPPEA